METTQTGRAAQWTRSRRRGRGAAVLAALAALALVAGACSGDDGGSAAPGTTRPGLRVLELPDLTLAAALTPFDSCDALLAWIHDEAAARVGPYGLPGTGWYGPVAAEGRATADGEPGAPVTGGGDDRVFSGTNVQVEGVDEPDIVKTDGTRIFAVASGRFHVVDASDAANPVRRGSVALDGAWGGELLVSGDTVLVLHPQVWAVPMLEGSLTDAGFVPEVPGSTITQLDVSDPDAPRVVARLALEGTYVSARLVDGVARIVVQSQPHLGMGFVAPTNGNPGAQARALEVNRSVVRESTLDDWLPSFVVTDGDGSVRAEGPVLECGAVHRPQQFSGFGMLSVLTVDLASGLAGGVSPGGSAGVMSGGETVYASPEHLYVATQEYVDWEALTPDQQQTVDQDYGTAIHRFDITDPEATTYEGSGRVPGRLLNQFSMDEHAGVLRVAVTEGSPWSEAAQSQSSVRTLELVDGALVERGAVAGLGAGETIHSVRFLGDLGYVVTFRQTDPLYVVDLRDPAAPRVAGELKIPGYSAYLHPVADGFLLGVGQDADESGAVLGSQVSLFDVRDPAAPARVAQALLGRGSSAVEWDHHAFLWWAPERLAVVPLESYDAQPFSGAVGFTVDVAAGVVAERGRVQHPPAAPAPVSVPRPLPVEPGGSSGEPGRAEPGSPPVADEGVALAPEGYTAPILRSLVIDGTLLTLSEAGLLASDAATLAPGTWIDFTT
jgi:uncharacterized secreted protein with C-terminal beta-propeller domain